MESVSGEYFLGLRCAWKIMGESGAEGAMVNMCCVGYVRADD